VRPAHVPYNDAKELLDNALDACETHCTLPDVHVRA
jgi:DNA topoisomerase VI subunit B